MAEITKLPGTIASYASDLRVGTVTLADGRTVEFGRSACLGFEPFVSQQVAVDKLLRDASGAWAAAELTLDAHPVKDLGPSLRVAAAQPSAPASIFTPGNGQRHFGWFSLLLERPLTADRVQLATQLERLGLGRVRVIERPAFTPTPGLRELELILAGQHLFLREEEGPLPADGLDLRQVPPGFSLGRYRVGVAAGMVDPLRLRLAEPETFQDPWGPSGQMRVASLLARELLADGGVGVVLHLAQDLVLGREDFVRRLSRVEEEACRPFGAWVDWVLSPARNRYRSTGMHAFGARDVEVDILNRHADVELDSAESAVLFACMLQVREGRLLADGETLYVPRDVKIGPFGATAQERTGYKYSVALRGEDAELVRQSDAHE